MNLFIKKTIVRWINNGNNCWRPEDYYSENNCMMISSMALGGALKVGESTPGDVIRVISAWAWIIIGAGVWKTCVYIR